MSKNNKPLYIDIFAGCGGMSLGLCNAGWKGLFAIEKNKMAFETLKYNLINHFDWPEWMPKKEFEIKYFINKYKKELRSLSGKVDLVVGGPPCQGFSMAGKRDGNDKRNKMVDSYIKFINLVRPKFLFFENVYGFTTATKKRTKLDEDTYSDYVVSKLRALGYNTHHEMVDFSEFGVPQKRKRFILVGVKNGDAKLFFSSIKSYKKLFLKKKGLSVNVSTEDAISDLKKSNGEVQSEDTPNFNMGIYVSTKSNYQKFLRKKVKESKLIPDSHRFTNHGKEVIKKFKYILKNSKEDKNIDEKVKLMFNTKKRSVTALDQNKPSPTLTTLPDDYIHYSEPRILTVREYARLQSFDDSFEFKGKYTTGGKQRTKEVPRYTQIGNAIPPLFGEQAGNVFLEMHQKNDRKKLTIQD
jgi:DNA (cytosine-5)-methyltransferase 1